MAKKFGLGKGLGALIPEEIVEETKSINTYIPLNNIKTNSDQPRKYFDNEKISELAESIKQHGIIQPLLVKKEGEYYTIIAGERRWRAAKLLGVKEVPVIEMDLDDKEVLEISLIENIQRQDLNAIEEAKAYKRLISEFKLTQEQLSERIGKSRTAITNTMRLLNLDGRVQNYIIEGIISEGHGRALLALEDKEIQYKVSEKVIDEKLSVRELESLLRNINNKKEISEDKSKEQKELNPYYKDIKDKLQNYFGTKVNINSNKNKGKIEIEYYSEDDLQRILEIIKI
ncbi:ParB/RepB/Spo0J family partition protein [Inconstantimicrobium mannanitabidum]|uniref:Chromosome partitioning protein ParB n=1 Tax=Inconstantimicrobium mannanitabidum TaxID=1604901 RepID=A0ACB5RH90_9CLOT|nr:ParB/RepB/Spo0J family partition protein [Clostridium sp. TW13]GKX68448.1 chromosome partitioning protein ParB [Clostridium sp. TW13]